ncbi:hypothetical protein [Mycobacteroides franklinii]|uniref:Uncharacterized protein n=1 Tax=Mycobacteroides franklinii TaxID=948102 RepID=A0A4R5P6N5_9MYCO|nr:hypothetical protein [Mycobacteroides franklinii]ORA55171.1 hypothetical protein BST24_26340 [Mycobacteroides franklinii]TDH19019.1 hypothetical protein EJ571_20785 [Mycobacteroides franklinii]
MKPIVKWLFNTAIEAAHEYLDEHPELGEQVAETIATKVVDALPRLVNNLTNITPWQWDDKALDGLAERVAKLLPALVRQFLGFGPQS